MLLIALLIAGSHTCRAWDWWPLPMAEPDTCRDTLCYFGEFNAMASTDATTPLLLNYDQQGLHSAEQFSADLSIGIFKPATRPNRWFDYDGAVVLTGRLQSGTQAGTGFFRELYAHARLYIVDVTVGIHRPSSPIGDETLTMGDLLFSANAHPIPRVTVGIDRYTSFPGSYGYLEVRGGLTHGWLKDDNPFVHNTLLHHKVIGGRIGGKLPVNITYEMHHAAQWGGESVRDGALGNDWQAYRNVFVGKSGGTLNNEVLNAQGNHLVSQMLCITAKGQGWHVDLYWQNLQEDGKIRFLGCGQNAKDGRWGIHAAQSYWPYISGLTLEFVNTTDQSGPFHDRDGMVFGGADNYYSNSVYEQGWTYYGRTIGFPLCSPQASRVMAWYGGVKGNIFGFRYRLIAQHSRHYGTYQQPQSAHNTGILLDVSRHVKQAWGMDFGVRLATDFGNCYGNRFGALITVRKCGLIKAY